MKKVFLSLAVLASVAMVSCKKNADAAADATADSTACTNDSCAAACQDSVPADSVVAPVDSAVVAE
ncbi:MAG: hypothetical protein IKL83_00620 [Muribaculaceae bacterium]|nr:hypothetical protein [Muribaculaceae bacterium]